MAQRMLKALADLERDYRGRNELRMRMLQAGSGIEAMILEDGDVGDTQIKTDLP